MHNKVGLSSPMMVFKAVIGLRRCLVMLLNKVGLYVALCMVKVLNKIGLCMARCLEMMLYVELRLEMEELIMVGLCMALRLEIYLDMIGLCMVVRLNFMVFLVKDVFVVALLNNFMVFLEMNDSMVALNYMVFFRDGRLHGGGTMGVAPMPASWEASGGGSGGKAELPTLPNGASPLEFGDWLCLCGPIMKDLSHVAGRWWDATVRQAHAFYMEWKGLSPLQRVQLCPRLPDELMASCFIRTEQRGVTLLLKAVSDEQQRELVVDRDLSSTAILFRLYVRHQPGGPGEKAIFLGQLTSLHKASTMQELASSLRTWRRYFARAREVDASLPDGVLLIKALEAAVVQIAKEDSQAAFRLSTSRQQLALDQHPTEQSIWSFSQCLLAEAETLSLLKSSSTTTTNASTPVRLKQMDAEASNSPQKPGTPGNYGNKSGKGHSTPMSEQPCKFFKSDTGCKAGRSCKWFYSWEGIEDKNSRCWICGGKDHRKSECKIKGNNKPSSYDSGLGEDVVEIKMQPTTKRLSSKLQLEKVMMV